MHRKRIFFRSVQKYLYHVQKNCLFLDPCRNITIQGQGVPGFPCRAIFGVREKILIFGEIYTSGIWLSKLLNCCPLSSAAISWAVTVLETTEKSKPTRGRQNKRQQAGRHEARRKECAVPDQRDWWIVKPKEGGLVVCPFKQIEDIRVTGSGAGRRASLLDETFQFPLQMR